MSQNIFITKKMNDELFENYLLNRLYPAVADDAMPQVKVYNQVSSGFTGTIDDPFTFVQFVPESTLTVISKFNQLLMTNYDDVEAALDGTYSIPTILDTLHSSVPDADAPEITAARAMAEKLVELGILAVEDLNNGAFFNNRTLIGFNHAEWTKEHGALDDAELPDIYQFSFPNPVQLSKEFIAAEEVFRLYDTNQNKYVTQTTPPEEADREKYFLMFNSLVKDTFSGQYATPLPSQVCYFYNHVTNKSVPQSQFIAASMGELQDLENQDIEYDHMDRIQYIDSFFIKVKLPRLLS